MPSEVTADVTPAAKPRLRDVLATPKMLLLLALGAASGFPNQVTESALQAWLKDVHVSNAQIGIFTYVALPYLLKPLWAPLLDRYALPGLGRRRGWMLAAQVLLVAAMALLAFQDPSFTLVGVSICAVAIVFMSASQDIVIDAYKADVAAPEERGPAAMVSTIGYRAASYVAPAVALVVADFFGWRPALLAVAAMMALFALATLWAPEPARHAAPESLGDSVVSAIKALIDRPGAAGLLVLVLLFKLGDAFSLKLFTPFMMDVGFSKTEIGVVIKTLWVGASVAGSAIGGVWMIRLGLFRAMLTFGVMQALSNLAYFVLALSGKNHVIMYAAVIIEHLTHAMGNIAVVALMMALCDARYSAFQYSFLAALSSLPRYGLGGPAGWVAQHWGWPRYYVVSFVLGVPGLLIVWLLRGRIRAIDVQH